MSQPAEPGAVFAGERANAEPVGESAPSDVGLSPTPVTAPAQALGVEETRLVWPPPDEDFEQIEVLDLQHTSRWAHSPAAAHQMGPFEAPAPGRTIIDAVLDADGREATREQERPLLAGGPQDPPGDPASRTTTDGWTRESPDVVAPARQRSGTGWMLALVAVLASAAGIAGGWFLRPMPGRAATASLAVETMPAGAEIAVDGTQRGRTPIRLALSPGEHRLTVNSGRVTREVAVNLAPGAEVVRSFDFSAADPAALGTAGPVGGLDVETRPPGAQVVIAGQPRGLTPLSIGGLPVGPVGVQLALAGRTVSQRVEIQAGKQAVLIVPMGGGANEGGWLAVRSGIPLRIVEGGRVVGTTDSERIMLPGGPHDLELVNERLEVRMTRRVVVQGGRQQAIDVTPPLGLVNINARPWAEVFWQEKRLGETPLGSVSLPVGDYELVFRHPQFGERTQSVTVRATTPARVSVAFAP